MAAAKRSRLWMNLKLRGGPGKRKARQLDEQDPEILS